MSKSVLVHTILALGLFTASMSVHADDPENKGSPTYVKDKISLLLNSQVFCSAVKNRCSTKDPRPIDADELKQIFPSLNTDRYNGNARSGKDSWEKMHPEGSLPETK